MAPILVEPSVFVYSGDLSGSYDHEQFNRFWSVFERFRGCVELNRCTVRCSSDLYEAVHNLFPYGSLSTRAGVPPEVMGAAQLVIRFLDKHVRRPIQEYTGREGSTSLGEQYAPVTPLYRNADIELAWRDLLGHAVMEASRSKLDDDDIVATHVADSCFVAQAKAVLVKCEESVLTLAVCRADVPAWPRRLVDPDVLKAIRERRQKLPTSNSVIYEDSGHQPAGEIKTALARFLGTGISIITRIGTTYFNPKVGHDCLLACHTNSDQLTFTISNGEEVTRGVINIPARTSTEQEVALIYLSGLFLDLCRDAGFPVSRDA